MPQSIERAEGSYHDIFVTMFRIESYDVLAGSYPSPLNLEGANGLLITGSTASAYDSEPWITTLSNFTRSLPITHPTLKIFGICFGHQLIARAFGAQVEKNPGGWEIGVTGLELSSIGSKVLGRNGKLAIQQFHGDHVPLVPAGFEVIASKQVCHVQGMVKRSGPTAGAPFSLSDIAVFTLQGHPEFSPRVVHSLLDIEQGGLPLAESRAHADKLGDGIAIARVLLGVMGFREPIQ
ncbi:hypothetical protein RQP46_007334 [Phenoliferia psychrophenolica]